MEAYVEFKPCRRTHCLYGYDFDYYVDVDFPRSGKAHFIDGKATNGWLFITPDLRFVYCLCYGTPFFYRVTNVSSKPIPRKKIDKIEEWYKITEEINRLKEKRKKLMQHKKIEF